MRYSFNWLKDLVSLEDVSFPDLLKGLSGIGLHAETIISEGGDYIFELELPANRGDLLSIWGLARETAARFRLPGPAFPFHPKREVLPAADGFKIKLGDPEACPFYAGSLVSGVRPAGSPEAMSERLKALGLRSLGNVVDITNYILLELGQPLHAFDADKICGGIEVRFARPGESLVTLDGQERKLDRGILVIADQAKVLALAGIMGGLESEVTEGTRNVFLESAYFRPETIRSGRRALGLETEASVRFEHGVDPDLVVAALERAKNLLREAAGGQPGGNVKSGRVPRKHPAIPFRPQQLKSVLGVDIPAEEIEGILKRIGCTLESKNQVWQVLPPSYRRDLEAEIDLVEETARFHGYDLVPSVLPQVQLLPGGRGVSARRTGEVEDLLAAAGFDQAVTSSFAGTAGGASVVKVMNPLSREQGFLRESLLPSLVETALYNLNQGNADLRFFELGHVYRAEGRGFIEKKRLGLVMTGRRADLLVLKSLLGKLSRAFDLDPLEVAPAGMPGFNAVESASLVAADGRAFALFGAVPAPKGVLLVAEVYLDDLWEVPFRPARFRDWPRVPPVVRDYSFLIPDTVSWAGVEKRVRGLSELISQVTFFDLYHSPELPVGFQSVAFSVCFQASDRTLTHGEIDAIQRELVAELERAGLQFRG